MKRFDCLAHALALALCLTPTALRADTFSEGPASWTETQIKTYIHQEVVKEVDRALAARGILPQQPPQALATAPQVLQQPFLAPLAQACANGACSTTYVGSDGTVYVTGDSGDVGEESSGGGRKGPIRRWLARHRSRRSGGGGGSGG